MLKFIQTNFSWIKDVGIVIFLVIVMYANQHYVTRNDFDTYTKANELAHTAINTTLVNVDKTLALMQQNQTILVKNEEQIKINTAFLAAIDMRLKDVENLGIEVRLREKTVKLAEIELRLKVLEKEAHPMGK